MKNLIKRIQNFVGKNELWERGDKIIVGVSSGADSTCLLDVLVKLMPKYDLKLIIAHINYGLRGEDSEQDEKFVQKLAEKYGLKTARLSVSGGKNFSENKMRKIRYDFFEKIRRENNFNLIAVAHNRDDQAETVLMHLLRGSGLQGLSAMKAKNEIIIRPLLNISREEILKYLEKNKLKYQIDITNENTNFFRNKIRHKLLPELEKNYNVEIKKVLAKMAMIVADDYDFLKREAGIKKQLVSGEKGDVKIKKILELHPAMQRQVLRSVISEIRTDLRNIESSHIEEIMKIIKSDKNKNQIVEFKGLKIIRKGDSIQMKI